MVTQNEVLKLPASIAVSWLDEEAKAWLEVEVTGQYLDWLIFRVLMPGAKPIMPIKGLHSIYDAPLALEDVYGLRVRMADIEAAVLDYRQRKGFEGWRKVTR